MSNVGLGSSIGIMGGNAWLCYINGGCAVQFPARTTPTIPHPPISEMGPPSKVALCFTQTLNKLKKSRVNLVVLTIK